MKEETFERGKEFTYGKWFWVVFIIERYNGRTFGNTVALEYYGLFAFRGKRIINLLGTFFRAGYGKTQGVELFNGCDADDTAQKRRRAEKNGNTVRTDDFGEGIGFGRVGVIDGLRR